MMGIEFIENATPSFRKSWDRARVELATADLFTCLPETVPRTAAAQLANDANLSVGDRVVIELRNDTLIGFFGNREVLHFLQPSPSLMKAVADSCGVAQGTVQKIHNLSKVAEISLC